MRTITLIGADMKIYFKAYQHRPAGYHPRAVFPSLEYCSNEWWEDLTGIPVRRFLSLTWWVWTISFGLEKA